MMARFLHFAFFSFLSLPVMAHEHMARGEGQTLPGGVVRSRAVVKQLFAPQAYDGDGQAEDMGIEAEIGVLAMALEYGLTDRLTLSFVAPYIFRNVARIDAERFRNSRLYRDKKELFYEKAIEKMVNLGYCDRSKCRDALHHMTLPIEQDIALPTGEIAKLPAGVEFDPFADSVILNAAAPSGGVVGFGDIELGALYNFFRSEKILVAVGTGLRFPTGTADVPVGFRPTGGGVFDLGLRLNFDYAPISGLWLSVQEEFQKALSNAESHETSLLDNTTFHAEATPRTVEYAGIRHAGFVQTSLGLGVISTKLLPWVISSRVSYAHERQKFIAGEEVSPGSTVYKAGGGLSFEMLAYDVPLGLDLFYETPLHGYDESFAFSSWTATLKGYLRF